MSTVDIDKLIDELIYANKDTHYDFEELPFDTFNSYGFKQDIKELLATQRTTLRAELLAKMPEKEYEIEGDPYLGYALGHNQALTEITKIVEEL